jgi:hypothetical protein
MVTIKQKIKIFNSDLKIAEQNRYKGLGTLFENKIFKEKL